MGEIAEMILDGILDQYTGEYIGKGVGCPRSFKKKKPVVSFKQQVLSVMWRGIAKGNPRNISHIQLDLIIEEYVHGILKLPQEIKESTACKHIMKDAKAFHTWFKKTYSHYQK